MTRSLGSWLWMAAFALGAFLETRWGPYGAPVLLLTVSGSLLGSILLERYLPEALLALVLVGLAWPHLLDLTVLDAPVRVYLVDLVVGTLCLSACWAWWRAPRRLPPSRSVLVLATVSLLLTGVGLARGNAPLDAIGTFRRVAVYGVMMLVAAQAFDRTVPWARLRQVMIVAGLLGVALAMWRLATGEGYREAYMAANHVPSRYLSYLEALGPMLAALVLASPGPVGLRHRLGRGLLFGVLVLGLVASNYRAVWLAFGVAMVVRFLATGGAAAMRRLLPVGLAMGAVAALAAGVLAVVRPGGSPLERFSMANLRQGMSWRGGSWSRALEVFLDHPLTGTGFGYHHRFTYLTGPNLDRPWVVDGMSIHNDLLWLLTNGGIVLAAVVLGLHALWLRGLLRQEADETGRDTRAALVGGYVAIAILAMLQPVLSHPSSAVLLYTLIGATWARPALETAALRLERAA